MSSSINGLNVPSFRALSQQFTQSAKKRALERQDSQPREIEASTTPAVNQRNLTRAQRDLEITLRGINREATGLLERAGSNTDMTDKVKHLTSEFEKSMTGRYEAFVEGGASSYIDFAEQTVAARREFRAQLRDLSRGLSEPTRPTDTVDVRSKNETRTADEADGRRHGGPLTNGNASTERAQRDLDAMAKGMDRELERFSRDFGDNADAVKKFTGMRDDFMGSIKKEFELLSEGKTPTYMDFAERVASLRQAFSRDVRSTFGDLEPSRRTDDRRTDDRRGDRDDRGGNTTVEPKATSGDRAAAEKIERPAGGLERPTTTGGTGSTDTTNPGVRNIERAKRDAEILLRGVDRDTSRLMNAMGDTAETREFSTAADAFRTMLDERLKKFIDEGGTDYMSFVEEMASARMSVGRLFARVGGPRLDRVG
jgi:hypothetical protein